MLLCPFFFSLFLFHLPFCVFVFLLLFLSRKIVSIKIVYLHRFTFFHIGTYSSFSIPSSCSHTRKRKICYGIDSRKTLNRLMCRCVAMVSSQRLIATTNRNKKKLRNIQPFYLVTLLLLPCTFQIQFLLLLCNDSYLDGFPTIC